ncbi:hypothetical protein STCU_11841 [Strigomonas culicis]|uniref:Uncharacterized protein n=1 Tax=Strigomonas culicis TaxID=28005 RepID=S9TFH1_9TRYP|nr:hypothetical protein STCU_11841 [Strigomonas culicis]|eukprot:EPY15674.1 hypothetical protein STCU_11841 [Strigomonas culicis]
MYVVDAHVRPFALLTLFCLYSTQPGFSTLQPYRRTTPVLLATEVAEDLLSLAALPPGGAPYALLRVEQQCLYALHRHGGLVLQPGVRDMSEVLKYVLEAHAQVGVPLLTMRAVADDAFFKRRRAARAAAVPPTDAKKKRVEEASPAATTEPAPPEHGDDPEGFDLFQYNQDAAATRVASGARDTFAIPFGADRYRQAYKEPKDTRSSYRVRAQHMRKAEERLRFLMQSDAEPETVGPASQQPLGASPPPEHGGKATVRAGGQRGRSQKRIMGMPLNVESALTVEEVESTKNVNARVTFASERFLEPVLVDLHDPATTAAPATTGHSFARSSAQKVGLDHIRRGLNLMAAPPTVAVGEAPHRADARAGPPRGNASLMEGRDRIRDLKAQYDALKQKIGFR